MNDAPPSAGETSLTGRAASFARERGRFLEAAFLVAALLIFLVSTVPNLANHPAVTDDEVWVLSASYKLAEEGVFGSEMFSGFYNAEKRYFFNMPAHHFVVAGIIAVIGDGIAEGRAAGILYGIATMALTYALARRIAGVGVAMLALALLLFLRLNVGFDTGLPLQEQSVNMRYDLAPVPLMLGGALLLLHRATLPRAVIAGAMSGLAFLLQFYGVFIIPALLAYLWLEPAERGRRLRMMAALVAASIAVVVPYAAFVAAYPDDFRGQAGTIDNRADFSDPAFYVDNLLDEPERFLRPLAIKEIPLGEDPATTPAQFLSFSETIKRRPSAKLAVIVGLPVGLAFTTYRAVKGGSRGYQMLALCLGGLVAEFTLLDQTKFLFYWIPVVPFLCIAIAAASWWLLVHARESRPRLLLAAGATAALLVVAAEGSFARLSGIRTAPDATPYTRVTDKVHEMVPPGSRVVGSTSLWYGLRDMEYRSYFLFFYLTRADAGPYKTTISGFLREYDPDYLVLTGLAWGELQDHLISTHYDDLLQYLDQNADIVLTLEGPDYDTYGYIEVWRFRD